MTEYFSRRQFLQAILRGLAALGAGASWAQTVAAGGKGAAPDAYAAALQRVTGGRKPEETGQLLLDIPDSAENGAIVPLTLESRLDRTKALHVLVERNPRPLAASFSFLDGAVPYASFRIKMNESSDVIALAESEGRIFWTRKRVKVAVGGCG